ncbi:MAG: hypothetical protein Q7R33_03590 [Nitrosarchaeum sp.]|nr:hypothetical protein [Nitrosarchaeum sp.]
MFQKTGSPQQMSVISACCVCGSTATNSIDGKLYCGNCKPNTEVDVQKPITEISIEPETTTESQSDNV